MTLSSGVPMTVRHVARLAGLNALFLICLSCGENYRPVATPQAPNPPNPGFSHIAVVLSSNGGNNPGAATTIDVSGDTAVSESKTGTSPAYVTLAANGTVVYVANRGEDTVSTFSPTSTATPTTISLPTGASPSFVATTQSAAVYVANSGNNTVSVISTVTNAVTNTVAVGADPVAMAELPNGTRVYVANAGTGGAGGSLTSFNTVDFSVNPPLAGVTWVSPAWVVARPDNQRIFVLDKGAGTVTEINTSGTTDVVMASVPVGVGAEYMIYDSTHSRVYVTNPVSGIVYALDGSDSAAGTISQLAAIPVAGADSVAALPDGSRFYVAAATVNGTNVSSSATVIDSSSLTVEKTIPITTVTQACAAFVNTPFELSIAASGDSTRVYVGNCDAGSTAIIATVANGSPGNGSAEDTLVMNMNAPLSAQSPGNGGTPPPQNPVFVVAGP